MIYKYTILIDGKVCKFVEYKAVALTVSYEMVVFLFVYSFVKLWFTSGSTEGYKLILRVQRYTQHTSQNTTQNNTNNAIT